MDHTCAMSGGPQQFIFENRHKGTPWGQGVSWLGGSVAAGGKGDRPLYAPGNIHGSSAVCWASSPHASALRLRLPPLGLTSPASLQATFPGSESGLPNQICDCFTVLVQVIQEWTSWGPQSCLAIVCEVWMGERVHSSLAPKRLRTTAPQYDMPDSPGSRITPLLAVPSL